MNSCCTRVDGCSSHCLREAGLTLVELMVSMVIGLFLVGGVATMYFSSFQSYRVLKQNAQIAQRERLAATYVGAVVQSAGYYNQPSLNRTSAFPDHGMFTTAGQFLAGADGTYPDLNKPTGSLPMDTLQLRMRLNDGGQVLNCLGDSNSTGTDGVVYSNKLTLDLDDPDNPQLECTLSYEDPDDAGAYKNNTEPLLDGVASLAFTYGVDTDDDGSADRYLDATQLNASTDTDWRDVRSIIMEIGFATRKAATADTNTVKFRAVFPMRIDS